MGRLYNFRIRLIRKKDGFYNGKKRCVMCGRKHGSDFPENFPDKYKLCCGCRYELSEMIRYKQTIEITKIKLKGIIRDLYSQRKDANTRQGRRSYTRYIQTEKKFLEGLDRLYELVTICE